MAVTVNEFGYKITEETDHPIELLGTATCWDDLRVSVGGSEHGVNAPDHIAFGPSGDLKADGFDDGPAEEEVYFEVQLPHDRLPASDLLAHVHWSNPNAATGYVVWGLEYSVTSRNGTFPAPTIATAAHYTAGTSAWIHKVSHLATVDGSGLGLSSILVGRFFRGAGEGTDTISGDVVGLNIDFHYQRAFLGSRQTFTH